LQDDVPEMQEFFLVNLTSVELIMNHSTSSPPRLGKATYTKLSLLFFLYELHAGYITLMYYHSSTYLPTVPIWDRVFWKKHCGTSNIFIITLASYFFKLCKNCKAIFTEELVINSWRAQLSEKFDWQCVDLIFVSKYKTETTMSKKLHDAITLFTLLKFSFYYSLLLGVVSYGFLTLSVNFMYHLLGQHNILLLNWAA